MNILKTICIRCKEEILVVGFDPSSHLRPASPMIVRCTECRADFSTTFSKCYFRPLELRV
jgi:hypothetical protein